MNNKIYSWNRNVSHHRIAMAKFSIYAYLMSLVSAWGTVLILGIKSTGERDYIAMSIAAAGFVHVGVFLAIFCGMTIMYRWVCDLDVSPPKIKAPPKAEKFYQTDTGWIKGK